MRKSPIKSVSQGTASPSSRVRRVLHRWHRWLGLAAAPLVIVLVVTGLILNRSPELGLDRAFAENRWLLAWYGIAPSGPALAYRVGENWLIGFGETLYLNAEPVKSGTGTLVGAVAADGMIVAALPQSLYLFTPEGELIEKLGGPLLPGALEAVALAPGGGVLARSAAAAFASDADVTRWESADGVEVGTWSMPAPPPEALLRAVLLRHRGQGLSWERVLLDLHSGRLLGQAGPYLMDAAAVLLGLLAASGVYNTLRRP